MTRFVQWFTSWLLFLSTGGAVFAVGNCSDIEGNPNVFSASATADTKEAARLLAQDYLLNQISTTVNSVSALTTTEISGVVSQTYASTGSAVSSLQLKGLKHLVCESNKRDDGITVLVYISLEDLEKSARSVEVQVGEYFDVMAQKELIGVPFTSDAYVAYLYTFLSPLPISLKHNGRTINDAKSHLEVMLRKHLNELAFDLSPIVAGTAGVEEQYSIPTRLVNADPGLIYQLTVPSINARASFMRGVGTLHLFMRPVKPIEEITGYLSFSLERIPPEVRDVAVMQLFTRKTSLALDFSDVIDVDFLVERQMDYIVATPRLAHVSPRTFSWEVGNRRLSNDQILRVSVDEVAGPLRLVINDNPQLSAVKTIAGVALRNDDLTPDLGITNHSEAAKQFVELHNFSQVQANLSKLRREGQVVWGKEADFVNPNLCWVLLIDPETERLKHVLTPYNLGRTDVKSGKQYDDIDEPFKGLIAIWVDFL
jgi:hypothetical protein